MSDYQFSGKVRTRFAPSPTGSLHLGGCRTALFNWLYARSNDGEFLLRIEDSDCKRSRDDFVDDIIQSMLWLGLRWDGEVIYQSRRFDRYVEAVDYLLFSGAAYRCYCDSTGVSKHSDGSRNLGKLSKHLCPNRDGGLDKIMVGSSNVVRFKVPAEEEEIAFQDVVYGKLDINASQIDDFIIMRSDGTPVYSLAVVVDDMDFAITHVIRGSDHISNTPKQLLLYRALDASFIPAFAHIPLIHSSTGEKLSKRHGDGSVSYYRDIGILPISMRNCLLRLGWGSEDVDMVNDEEALSLFGLEGIKRSPAKFDFAKLISINKHYLCVMDDEKLVTLVYPILEKMKCGSISTEQVRFFSSGISSMKLRADTVQELAEMLFFYISELPIKKSDVAVDVIENNQVVLTGICGFLEGLCDWDFDSIKSAIKNFCNSNYTEVGITYKVLRAAMVGEMNAPGILEIMVIFGKSECLARMRDVLT